ncbi:hypothetical protein ACDX78_17895 [Virgibacillus oceani]
MENFLYGIYAFLIAIISVITGEIVTFVMLGLILIRLQNIHSTLNELLKANRGKTN